MTQSYTTTLGAPLTEAEYAAMTKALALVKFYLEHTPQDLTPAALLGVSTTIIDLGFKLRDAVNKGLGEANKRAFSESVKRPVNHLRLVREPHTLNITKKDLEMLDLVNSTLGDVPK